MIVRKVFRPDDSGRERIEAALKKFFYPESRDVDAEHTENRLPGDPSASSKKHPEPDPDPERQL